MPYEFEYNKKHIPRHLNKNVKIAKEDHEKIREDYKILKSQRKTAKKWNVSRRLIQFILDPEKHKEQKEKFKERQKTGIYYTKEKQKEYIKKYRHHKQELKLKGLLEEE